MKIKGFILFVVVVLLIYFLVRIFFPDIFWEKVKIIDRVFVPQGRTLYIKDLKDGLVSQYLVEGNIITSFFDYSGGELLYSSYNVEPPVEANKIYAFNTRTKRTRQFYSLGKGNFEIIDARFNKKINQLVALCEVNGSNYLFVTDGSSRKEKRLFPVQYYFSDSIDVADSNVLISNSYSNYFISYWHSLQNKGMLNIRMINIKDGTNITIEVAGYNAIFNPNDHNEILAMGQDKQLFVYNRKTKVKRDYNIKCKYIRWIKGSNSLLVVVPKPWSLAVEAADIGIYDLDKKKYIRIMGGYSFVDKAFYE